MPYPRPNHARYTSVDTLVSACSPIQNYGGRQSPRNTLVATPSPTHALNQGDPNADWRFHYIDLGTTYPSVSPVQIPDAPPICLAPPRQSQETQSIPWEVVKHEHDVTGRTSPSSFAMVKTSVVSHFQAWRMEIVGLAIALAAMASFVAVVAYFSDRPLSAWPSSAITLNALVAILAAITTASISIPLASGMGQLKWIHFRESRAPLSDMEYFDEASRGALGGLELLFRMRGGITGSFGAMIMILALLLSPFAQQIIAYRVRIVLVDDGAMTRRALNYDLALTEGNGIIPALSMKAAVYDGLFAAGSRLKKSSLECATGNCAFGEIETLAVCQSCIDMSAHMTRYCPNGTPAGGDMSNCGWQLPSGAMLNSSSDVFSMTPLFPNKTDSTSYSTIMRLVFMGVETESNSGTKTTKPWAKQCTLSACVQRILSSVELGQPVELVTSEYKNETIPTATQTNPTSVEITSPVTDTTYTISARSLQAWRSWFATVFQAGAASTGQEATSTHYATDTVRSLDDARSLDGGLEGTISSLARSISTHLRSTPSTLPVLGQSLVEEAHIHVRWGFVVLPVTAVLASCVFLGMVGYQTWRTRTQLWKTSVLAVLLHGLDHDVRARFSDLEGLGVKRKEARVVEVRLEGTGLGGEVLRAGGVY